jgi:hypothetical protein
MTDSTLLALAGRLGLDVLALLVLVGLLHRRRATAPEMALVFTALNVGLFAAVSVIGLGDFPTGIGFGLFGLLSLVRLRSAAFTLKDVAYTFVALVLGLVNGLPERNVTVILALDLVILVAVWITDDSRGASSTRVMRVTLDRAVTDIEAIRAELSQRLQTPSLSVAVEDVDFVRETTRVSVRYESEDTWWQWRDAAAADAAAETREEVGRLDR